jgi:hypothetical protein
MKNQLLQLLVGCWMTGLAAFLLAVRYERPDNQTTNVK